MSKLTDGLKTWIAQRLAGSSARLAVAEINAVLSRQRAVLEQCKADQQWPDGINPGDLEKSINLLEVGLRRAQEAASAELEASMTNAAAEARALAVAELRAFESLADAPSPAVPATPAAADVSSSAEPATPLTKKQQRQP